MTDPKRKDVVIIGGGPAGLNAALVLGRARKEVLLCDGGTRRNLMAEHIHGFLTRDGTPPLEFRRIAREQLQPYGGVEVRDVGIASVERIASGFRAVLAGGDAVECRRVLLATGLVDELPELPGYRELWGKGIFQCPYCHGWEVRDRAFGLLATSTLLLDFSLLLTGWSRDVIAFTQGTLEVSTEQRQRLEREHLETSIPGIHAAGDLTTYLQGAIFAASAGFQAAAMINHALNMENAGSGLPAGS